MCVQIYVHNNGENLVLEAEKNIAVASVLRKAGLLALPCGVGKCGKCIIYANTEPTAEETAMLGTEKIALGLRLACYTKVHEGLEITIPTKQELSVLTTYSKMEYIYDPLVKRIAIKMNEPSLDDQRSDLQRILDSCGYKKSFLSFSKLAKLPYMLRSNTVQYAVVDSLDLIGFGKNPDCYGLIVDIGTTTLAVMLINATEQKILVSRGWQNAQASYGADVISRIQREIEWKNNGKQGVNPLQRTIIEQINGVLEQLLHENHIEDVDFICFTGNTTMMHMLCGLPCEYISKAPFIPVTMSENRLHAESLGIHSSAVCYLMPCISSYIGADIVASLLAADGHHPQKPFILIDLGTNAEIVLAWGNKLLSCSAAAGPCFEGATLSCGMAGQNGAIDKVSADQNNGFIFSTIGDVQAEGICGSGVLDSIALLLDKQLIDETGKLCVENAEFSTWLYNDAFYLTDYVYISQKDIREVQLAKAAVRAGIEILLQEAGLVFEDIDRLYLAGGFGSAMRKESAVRIGLIPQQLLEKVHVLGNGASFGALRYMTESKVQENVHELIQKMRYIELSSHMGFSNFYVEHMFFPV